jgi:site-specific DNA recombinase
MNTTENLNDSLAIFSPFAKGKEQIRQMTNNCVIYTRVSTKEQAENNMSLSTQLKACELFATKNNYSILNHFGGTYESAKNDERKEFTRMLSFVKKSKEKISFIIVYSVDRFSRSGGNAIYITEQLQKQGIMVVSVTQPNDSSTPSGVLQQNIQYIFSEYDNKLRREKCMVGTKEALLRGEWCGVLPTGYTKAIINGEKKIIVSEKGKLLKKAFIWKANDNLSIEEIRIRLKSLGFPINHQRLSKIFRNPFYCGLIAHKSLEGKIVKGKHEALISKEMFLKVNEILSVRKHGLKYNKESDFVPLKRFLKCDHCEQNMTGYMVKAKKLWYYKCRTKGCSNNKSAIALHESFKELLNPYTLNLSSNLTALIKKQLLFVLNQQLEIKFEEQAMYNKQLSEINSKLDRIEERFILEEITREQFYKYSEKFKSEKALILKSIQKTQIKESNFEIAVENLIKIASNLPSMWTSSNSNGKQKLQKFIFPDGVYYSKKNDQCRTKIVNPLFSYISRQSTLLSQNKTGIIEDFSNDACLVAEGRVELPALEL